MEGAWKFLLALGSGTGLVLILRWYWWRINAWSEISAMIASFVDLARSRIRAMHGALPGRATCAPTRG